MEYKYPYFRGLNFLNKDILNLGLIKFSYLNFDFI